MSCYSKEKTDRNDYNNICKSHSAKSDRELYRICPSKLSKRELEDLYFSLLENNLDLKRTINGQQDKIKGLSTKVQRMTSAQKSLQAKEMKECCVGTKSVINEQKESITELKQANHKMAERIRLLNMRLCSAKQFMNKSPQMSTSKCPRCTTPTTPKKHNCLDKASEPVLKMSTSCQYVDRDAVSVKSAQTETREMERMHEDQPCDENRCRNLMEELKLKIINLQEELCHVHDEYSNRIGRLECEVCEVRKENLRVTSERRASEHELQSAVRRTSEMLADLRNTEAKCVELSTDLALEKRKVAELETRLKSANISDRVNKTIEDHLTTINETNTPLQDTDAPLQDTNAPVQDTNAPVYEKNDPFQEKSASTQGLNVPFQGKNGSVHGINASFQGTDVQFQGKNTSVQGINAPNAQFQVPNAQFEGPNAQFQVPNAQFQVPNAQFQGPNTQFQGPNAQFQGLNVPFQGTYGSVQGPNVPFQGPNVPYHGTNVPFQDSKGTCTANHICTCPPCLKDERTPTKETKAVACACPPPWGETPTEYTNKTISPKTTPNKTLSNKSGTNKFFGKMTNKTSNKATSTKATPTPTATECVTCGCPFEKGTEVLPSPFKNTKSVVCACPPSRDVNTSEKVCPAIRDTIFTPAKDTKSVECECPPKDGLQAEVLPEDRQQARVLSKDRLPARVFSKEKQQAHVLPKDRQQAELLPKPAQATGTTKECTKDGKCTYCGCLQAEGDPMEMNRRSSFSKTGTQAPPTVGDMAWSPHSPQAIPEDSKLSKASDDSGYLDANKSSDLDEAGLNKVNQELMKRIIELQNQVDALKIAGGGELPAVKQSQLSEATARRYSDVTATSDSNANRASFSDANRASFSDGNRVTLSEANRAIYSDGSRRNSVSSAEKSTKNIEKQNLNSADVRTQNTPQVLTRRSDDWSAKKTGIGSSKQSILTTEELDDKQERRHSSVSFVPCLQNYDSKEPVSDGLLCGKAQVHTGTEPTSSNPEPGSSNQILDTNESKDTGNVVNINPSRRRSSLTERRPNEQTPGLDASNSKSKNDQGKSATVSPEKLKSSDTKKRSPSIQTDLANTVSKLLKDVDEEAQTSPEKLQYSENKRKSLSNQEIEFNAWTDQQDADKTEMDTRNHDLPFTEEQRLSNLGLAMDNTPIVPEDIELLPGKMKPPKEFTRDTTGLGQPDNAKDPQATTSKETCELCAACSYNKECASLHRNNKRDSKSGHDTKKTQGTKNDRHNSLQIPGPIPTAEHTNKDSKKTGLKVDKKTDLQTNKNKHKSSKNKKDSINKEPLIRNPLNFRRKSSGVNEVVALPDVPFLNRQLRPEEDLPDVSRNNNFITLSKDSINMKHKNRYSTVVKDSSGRAVAEVSRKNYFGERLMSPLTENVDTQEQSTQVEQKEQKNTTEKEPESDVKSEDLSDKVQSKLVERHTSRARRSMSVYRRASGTLCFRTLPAGAARACQCAGQVDGQCVGKHYNKGVQVDQQEDKKQPPEYQPAQYQSPLYPPSQNQQPQKYPPQNVPPSTMTEVGTYTVDSKQTRGTSPDRTELDMSNMSDLSMEKAAISLSQPRSFSPGEDKSLALTTDSYCSTATNMTNYTLSEGEMPMSSPRRTSHEREKRKSDDAGPNAPAQKMEAALQAITEELARCKNMLHAQRPSECATQRESCQTQTSMADPSRPIALRRGVATQSIGDAYAPKCNFTLHIGTVVLSDEAVLNSRDKTLVLTWKFYDQNIAMTRMRAGRVVLFDFSTEYDIKITDDFLHYMKHEEMPIVICELDKESEPFASCALPLRDALLHTNRRADMSLALVAGPRMLKARAANGAAADLLDAGDEMGVIDLWCMLRADAKLLPAINRAIAQPSVANAQPTPRHNSRVMQQIIGEDHSIDLELTLQQAEASHMQHRISDNDYYGGGEYPRKPQHPWGFTTKVPSILELDANTQTPPLNYDPSKYPAVRSRHSSLEEGPAPPADHIPTDPPIIYEDPERESDIIVNEVEPKIRTHGDMKQAVEKSGIQNDFRKMNKTEDDLVSQAQSSIGSLKSVLARLHRRGSPRIVRRDSGHPFHSIKASEAMRKSAIREEPSETEIYRKYENISKLLIAPNRQDSTKKSVTIKPKSNEELFDDEPQRDVDDAPTSDEDLNSGPKSVDITVLWLALNEECEAMVDPHVQRVYVAYTFLGRAGAELETPVSLPKPKHYVDKCYFNFKKTFELEDNDLPKLGHMARCRASKMTEDEKDCIVFSVVSEPPEDPLGLETCEDIGYAYLYLGDLLAYSSGSPSYTEVVPVRAARGAAGVCGVLAVRLDGLDVVRRTLLLPHSEPDVPHAASSPALPAWPHAPS